MSKSRCGSKDAYTVIAERAYYKWLAAGSPQSNGEEFWLAAEQELTHANVQLEEVEIVDDPLYNLSSPYTKVY